MSMNVLQPPSEEFKRAVASALGLARVSPDEAVRFMVDQVPVYAQYAPDESQARAGGCANCIYLGLWADHWPGYPAAPHGMIWLFEYGIRSMGGDLHRQVYATLLHEMDHALQRDHVLEGLRQAKLNGYQVQARPQISGCRPCYR
jgi:hypothetical protein